MTTSSKIKQWQVELLLTLISAAVFIFYFQHLVFNLNSVLFKVNGDSLKNYYTYVYHIKHDADALTFSGMNYPFGEHIVYTDCQPLLTLILRLLPFTHSRLIGIMHGLILFSFIITPLILFRTFLHLNVQRLPAFLFSLGIAFLAPQIQRIGGHFGLAYVCAIPLMVLLTVRYMKQPSAKTGFFLFLNNCCLFLIHPYMGLGTSLFSLTVLGIYELMNLNRKVWIKPFIKLFFVTIGPVVLFKLFMIITDGHPLRPSEPYGVDIMTGAANLETVFTPAVGPFGQLLKSIIKVKDSEWEAQSYVGLFSTLALVLATLLLPFYYKKIHLPKPAFALFITALLFLLFSFGVHIMIFRKLHIEFSALNQFRVLGRFAWYFYFVLPVFIGVLVSQLSERFLTASRQRLAVGSTALLFFLLNLYEADASLKFIMENNFQAKNIFDEATLSDKERIILQRVRFQKAAALLPLPMFHVGSEVYQRNGDESIGTAMIWSWHTGLPLLSVMMSRTSLTETEESIELFNIYKKKRPVFEKMGDQPLLIIRTNNNQKEDELRILKQLTPFDSLDNLKFYYADKNHFKLSDHEKEKFVTLTLERDTVQNTLFIPFENRKPFLDAQIDGYETIASIDSTGFVTDDYVVSFKYHLTGKKFRYIHNNFFIEKKSKDVFTWACFTSIRATCGFYDNMMVFEYRIRLEKGFNYNFMLNGGTKENYHVTDFLLRPESLNVKHNDKGVMSYNNYPE